MITFEVDDRALRDALARLVRAVDDPTEAMNDLGDDLATHIREHLGRGIDPWGTSFEPLKLRQGVPLNDTRQHLYNRINHQVVGRSVEVGLLDAEANKIGRVHQFGATIKPKNGQYLRFKDKGGGWHALTQVTVPARPFMPIRDGMADLPEPWAQSLVEVLKHHLDQAVDPA